MSTVNKNNNMSDVRPRLCVMEKGPKGYGFHLHGEKGKTGQFIRLVEPDTPAAAAGLRAGDRLAFVNGERVEGERHQLVVDRIRATTGSLELVVIDAEVAELLKKHNLPCRKEFVTEGIPVPDRDSDSDRGDAKEESGPPARENGDVVSKMLLRSSIKVGLLGVIGTSSAVHLGSLELLSAHFKSMTKDKITWK